MNREEHSFLTAVSTAARLTMNQFVRSGRTSLRETAAAKQNSDALIESIGLQEQDVPAPCRS